MRAALLAILCACGGTADVVDSHCIKAFTGLYGSSNTVNIPEGACEIADNCVIRFRNVLECRRGYSVTASVGGPLNAIAFKEGQVVAITYDSPSSTGTLRAYNPATKVWTTLPMNPGGLTLDKPGAGVYPRTRFVSVNKALYFQSKYGLTKVEALSGAACRPALQPMNWGGAIIWCSFAVPSAGTPTWLSAASHVAYRLTMCRLGANGELIESEPCPRFLGTNTSGGATQTTISIQNAYMLPADAFYRLSRSKQVANTDDPSDEMFLVAEIVPAQALDASGYRTFASPVGSASAIYTTYVDPTSDTSLYVPLYTNPISGNGIASANTSAPVAADMAYFKNRMHYLNTSDVQRVTIRVIGTGTGGIVDGNTLTVNGVTFTFRTSPASALTDIQLVTAGTVAQNLAAQAQYIAGVLSRYFSTLTPTPPQAVIAYPISIGSVDAGQVLIQRIVPGAEPITVKTSSANGWGNDYTAGTTSNPNAQAAGWMWSNISQPEGVPTLNNNPIGDQTAAGYRLIALKETMFAFKQDGLWKITDDGSALGPQLQLMDPTVRLVAPESAVALDNFILALADQGVILVTETGAVLNITHTQTEQELFKLMAYVGPTALGTLAFGIAYQPEHTYILALPESPNATSCTIQYVYNLQTQTWTRWTLPGVLSGAVNPDTRQLYWGRSDGTLWIERKNMDSTDYQDPGFTIASPTATQTASLVFTGDLRTGSTPFAVGDVVQQWQSIYALAQRVIAVAYSSQNNQTTVTLDKAPTHAWNQAVNLTIVKAIPSTIRFLPFHAGEPLTDKNWENCYISFRYCDLDFMQVGYASEKYPITSTAIERINNADGSTNAPIILETWGAGTWGSRIWGRQARDVVIKCTMPQEFDHSAQLTLSLTFPCAMSRFELNAIDLKISGASDRVVR